MHTQELVCESTYRGIHWSFNLILSESYRGLLCSSPLGPYLQVSVASPLKHSPQTITLTWICLYLGPLLGSLTAGHSTKTLIITTLTLKGGLIGPLSLGRDAGEMPSLARLPVDEGSVLDGSVVPDDDGLFLPLDAGVEVGAPGDVLVEEVEDGVGFLLFEADNVTGDWKCKCMSFYIEERLVVTYTEGSRIATFHR